jgi:2-polyprenyl-6-methoxyphenol hydroxylase-like FAD-dependent oxidoreductase
MDVLISGAGIAGLTTAYWLRRFGYTPTIVERAPSLVTGGYKIDVRGSALAVLERMAIHDAVVAASTHMQGATLVDRQGTVISHMGGDEFGHRVGDDLEIVRGTLCQILLDRATDVELIFGDQIESITQSADSAQVAFTRGAPRQFDLVIGADGLHSNVRRRVFGEESLYLRDLGMYLCVYSVPNYLDLDREEAQYSEIGRVAALWSTRDDENAKACVGFAAPPSPIGLHDRAQQEQAIRTVYEGIGWEVPRLLDLMPEAADWYFDVAAQVEMASWSQDRVVLVGDAAYCPSPMAGQGSSLALIGAYVLAGELAAASGDLEAAFAEYDRAMRPFITVNQQLGIESARFMTSKPEETSPELSGEMVESVIDRSTQRISHAANAIALKDYSAFFSSQSTA